MAEDSSASDDDFDIEPEGSAYEISLQPAADEGSGYHTRNDPRQGRQWHRQDISQRKGAISFRCNMIDVVHGKWAPDSDDYATLVVFLFRFDVKKRSRRISRVEMTFSFFGANDEDPYSRPAVHAISFDGSFSLAEEKNSESTTKGVEGTAGLTGAQFAELSSTLKWERTVTRDKKTYTTVVGNKYRRNYEFGPDDQANWVLLENDTLKTGVPVAFRAAVLLKREDNLPFKCETTFNVQADLRHRLEDFFASKVIDDPVLFNPQVKVERDITLKAVKHMDGNAMGSFDVEAVGDVTFLRIRDKAIKNE
ncbi:hypothetical protein M406DRAFT_350198 [Cryphonectria parasitica EP155]|uniref:Uncharacterized protein n=1 Tax=Cryphonectria parasitica (strain ATCC 38755 / EP155) TaxID=660469 RepID=A0A9P5CR17_CRYP1|nr:uncharacterized protein M406DRAFT_350198 [Cryphonectria parasitica EP155]KAF3766655.1 hypothetical protein M406DRAFT_350198 [Cryphonectria parasitica EP155]